MYILPHLCVAKDFHQMDFWFEFLDIHMNEKKKLAMIAMALHGKT